MTADPPKDIGKLFRDGTAIDQALKRAALEAKREHQRLGMPAAAWRDGRVVWVPVEELVDPPGKPT